MLNVLQYKFCKLLQITNKYQSEANQKEANFDESFVIIFFLLQGVRQDFIGYLILIRNQTMYCSTCRI